jgi:GGDEF domain-containing protein
MLQGNSLLLLMMGLVVVVILWAGYKLYMARIWQQKRSAAGQSASKHMDTRPIEYTILEAQQTTRWLSFVYAFTRRTKYFIEAAVALLLAALYILWPAGTLAQEIWRFVISVIILGGLAIGLSYWHGWAEQQERKLARRIQWTEEQLLISYGVVTRHPATGFYTRDFLIQMLETFLGQQVGESLPLACLMLEIRGLAEFEQKQGKEKAMDVLKQVGKMLSRSARPYDLIGHENDQRLTLILLRYPARLSIRDRFVGDTQHTVLDEINRTHDCQLELVWTRANLPDDAPTPVQLLSRARNSLDHPEKDIHHEQDKAAPALA